MKFQKNDKVELKKDLYHLPVGLEGKVLQVSEDAVNIEFKGHFELYSLCIRDAEEHLRLMK